MEPSLQRRPSMIRPVNSSTIFTSPLLDEVLDVAVVERLALSDCTRWLTSCEFCGA
jgi:hypothetical protein